MAGSALVLDGDGVLREMRREALAGGGSRVVGRSAGGAPFSPAVLTDTVRRVLGQRETS